MQGQRETGETGDHLLSRKLAGGGPVFKGRHESFRTGGDLEGREFFKLYSSWGEQESEGTKEVTDGL